MAQTPSFPPRQLLRRPAVWSRDPLAAWKRATSLDEAGRIVWAARQNLLTVGLRELCEFHRNSLADVAAVLGRSYSQTWRKLSGTVPATPADLARWEWLVRAGLRGDPPTGPVSAEVIRALDAGTPPLSAVATRRSGGIRPQVAATDGQGERRAQPGVAAQPARFFAPMSCPCRAPAICS